MVDATLLRRIHRVQSLGYLLCLVFCDKILQGSRVQPTARQAETFTERLSGVEELLGDGDRNLHTLVIPWYEPCGKLSNSVSGLLRQAESSVQTLVTPFLKPIFATARLDSQAVPVLEALRGVGIKTAIVSNTPWGSPAGAWREELTRHGLLDKVDATVCCMDVGWRKPHRAPFDRALSLLEVAPAEALFVGDDQRWDVVGAQNAGVRPVILGPGVGKSPADHLSIQDLRGIIELSTAGGVA